MYNLVACENIYFYNNISVYHFRIFLPTFWGVIPQCNGSSVQNEQIDQIEVMGYKISSPVFSHLTELSNSHRTETLGICIKSLFFLYNGGPQNSRTPATRSASALLPNHLHHLEPSATRANLSASKVNQVLTWPNLKLVKKRFLNIQHNKSTKLTPPLVPKDQWSPTPFFFTPPPSKIPAFPSLSSD